MKKIIVLFALSFFLVSVNYAQTDTRRTDTSTNSQRSMKKGLRKNARKQDSKNNGSGSLTPMNNGSGRADSSNSGNGTNGTTTPNQIPGQSQFQQRIQQQTQRRHRVQHQQLQHQRHTNNYFAVKGNKYLSYKKAAVLQLRLFYTFISSSIHCLLQLVLYITKGHCNEEIHNTTTN